MSKKLIKEKIRDSFLRRALRNFAAHYPLSRAAAFAGQDFEVLKERISLARDDSLKRLPELVERFRASAERAGATVHCCGRPGEARETIRRILRDKGADMLIKSKSMTSEEIRLNAYLEKGGVRCLETDLGEWIIQLAGERPSHMVMPAIHKNRDEVAELFSTATGRRCPADIPSLVETARETLREGFLSARVGLSGANIAMADSGALCIVTNEGNGRLVTTLPQTHIALVGIDKIVPSLREALDILTMLPKNATGQKITSYVSFIKGPSAPERELHIVLLDNGRSELARDPRFSEALRCIRCGACANVCPVYEIVGGHLFGHIYVGGIGLVLTPFFHGDEHARDILGLCIGCRRCNEICAAGIDIEGLILDLRERGAKLPGQRAMFGVFMKNRALFHTALRTAYFAQKPFQGKDGRIRHLPMILSGDTGNRSLPPIAERPFRDVVREKAGNAEGGDDRQRVLFFSGCLADFVFPDLCRDVMEGLERLGYSVSFPQEQLCCGIPARYSGEMEIARDMARLNTDALLKEGADFVVTICPTCTMSLRHDFPQLLVQEPEYHVKAVELAAKVFNFAELAARKIPPDAAVADREAITYHDACHLRRGCRVWQEPRAVLERIAGHGIVEMEGSDTCCGFGGSYAFKYPEISWEILKKKIDAIAATGALTVAVDCPGCKMQIEGGLDVESRVRVEHTATLVAEKLR